MSRILFCSTLMLAAALLPVRAAQQQRASLAALDAACADALAQWQVPGLAVVIVQDERVMFLKGFGRRRFDAAESVDADTVFPLASCSKAFTTLAAGMLIDDGKLGWDDHVRKHVPYFKLADPLADANVSLRDLFSHRTGIAGHTALWYRAPWSLEQRIKKLAFLAQEHSFRDRFEYQTILFGAGGLAVGNAANSTWNDVVQTRILDPLEMKSSSPTAARVFQNVNVASPHRRPPRGKTDIIPRYPLEDPDPAGSVHATARDLAKFLQFQLGAGTWKGRRLISTANLHEPHRPQIVIRKEGFAEVMNPDTWQISYGLGWIVQDYRGHGLLLHGGAIDGFRSHITLVPKARLGIALLNNLDGTFMNLALSQTIVDLILGLPAKDWNAYYLKTQQADQATEWLRHQKVLDERRQGTRPTLPLEAYAGKYDDAAYGSAQVLVKDGKLLWQWGSIACPLEHYHDDTFLANNGRLVDAFFVFKLDRTQVKAVEALDRTFRRR